MRRNFLKSDRLNFLFNKRFLWVSIPCALLIWSLFYFRVNLNPQIGQDFFFSKSSDIFQKNQKINKKFPFDGNQLLLGFPSNDILRDKYLERIERITKALESYDGVKEVVSIVKGPSDPEDALTNPLWKRIITGNHENVSFISVYLANKKNNSKTIKKIEEIIKEYDKVGIPIKMAGIPYFIEQMKRNLKEDMTKFLIVAVILCSFTILVINRSFFLMFLSVGVSLTAAAFSLLTLKFFGQGIGILTANLMVIAYVLSQSHFIFYSSNFQKNGDTSKAFYKTLPASFWSMITTLLGFLGLVFVEAKPLVQLGQGGVIATLSAFIICYLFLPSALSFFNTKKKENMRIKFALFEHRKISKLLIGVYLVAALALGTFGLLKLNTDPSLISYFNKDAEIHKQLSFLNDHGGSNILRVIVKKKDGTRLDNEENYDDLSKLQESFSSHEFVGTVISLPVLLEEADEHWLGQFLTWGWTIDLLTSDVMDNVGKGFLNAEHTQTAFVLRMVEATSKDVNRLEVIDDLKKMVEESPFAWIDPAGPYYLQGELAKSVKYSLITGVSAIVGIFFFVVLWISRSFLLSFCISFFLSLLVIITYGLMGLLGIPLDLISSPAISITLGISIDGFIHLIRAVKEEGSQIEKLSSWRKGLKSQSQGILTSGITIIVGFSAFLFSSFLPSQRFGGIILFGTLLSLPLILTVIPSTFQLFVQSKRSF